MVREGCLEEGTAVNWNQMAVLEREYRAFSVLGRHSTLSHTPAAPEGL
jgi:hypothetical protein